MALVADKSRTTLKENAMLRKFAVLLFALVLIGCEKVQQTTVEAPAIQMAHRMTEALASGNAGSVEEKLGHIPEGTPGRNKIVAHLTDLKKRDAVALAKDQRAHEKLAAANGIIARRAYVDMAREKFLDSGMDIKVSVSGKSATQLNLKYALFNDVWVHRIRKDSDGFRAMGFKKIDFDNGYDYHVILTF
jgi:hypothetical protein